MRFLWPHGWEAAAREPEVALLFETRGRRVLALASNFPYELWADAVFLGDGGHRCAEGEALLDRWDARSADRVVVRLHWIDPERTVVYSRRLFPDPFLAVQDDEEWTCAIDASISFGAKACLQLPRQNRVDRPPSPGPALPLSAAGLARPWRCADPGLLPARIVPVAPRALGTWTAPGAPCAPRLPDAGEDLAAGIARGLPPGLACTTLDLGRIALHRFEVEGGPALLVHGEVADLAGTWGTPHRRKIRLVDAVVRGGAPLGWRGGRYLHVVHEPGRPPAIRVWRREYPLAWRTLPAPSDPRDAAILDACRANLVACVDGGLVDTCWRERAQWTGDLRMSAMAVRALASSDEVVGLALRQVAASWDPEVGMVRGVWPASPPRDAWIPGYHPAFCLAAIEHGLDREPEAARVVRESLPLWRARFVQDGLLRGGFPEGAWWFVDWDPTTRTPPGEPPRPDDASAAAGPDAVTNAWFHEACARLGLPAIDPLAFDEAYWTGRAYRLVAGGGESPQATAAAILAFPDSPHAAAAIDWLLEEHRQGRIARRVTPYFAWFVARAIGTRSEEAMLDFVREHYGPVAARLGTIPERTNEEASLAHGWSIGVASILVR